jgi:rRNA maturation endonuclease Nob1
MRQISKWLLHCTGCGHAYETAGSERDVICPRCGGFVSITEHITYIETEEEKQDDLRGN